MSEENRPNLHAVGFSCDILTSLAKRIRGNAALAGFGLVFPLVSDKIADFVNEIDEMLDEEFGGYTSEDES